jgi:crotonobetainyl-CoA:carnitine CoA-transferase CaiB-like acyl-CoA transferase
MAQTEVAAYLGGEYYLQGPCADQPPAQRGNAADYAVPHGVYPCAGDDRWCAIAVVGDGTFERFAHCLGWAMEPHLATLEGRRLVEVELDARITEWTRVRKPEEVAETLQAAGVSAVPVQNAEDHRADPHLAARRAIVTVEHPEVGPERHIGNPLRMRGSRLVTAGAAPLLGVDTEDVLTRVLGLSRQDVERLVSEGVCR